MLTSATTTVNSRTDGHITASPGAVGSALSAAAGTLHLASKQILLAGVLLAGVLAVFFASALVPGTVLAPAEGISMTPFFSEAGLGYMPGAYNWLLFDQACQFVPWRHFAWESLRSGVLPLWDPRSSAGTPFLVIVDMKRPTGLLSRLALTNLMHGGMKVGVQDLPPLVAAAGFVDVQSGATRFGPLGFVAARSAPAAP